MAERTLKINADLTDLKVGLKDLVASIDRLNKKLDEVGTRTKTNMTQAADGTRKVKQAVSELDMEYNKLKTRYNQLQSRRSSLDKKQKQELSEIIAKMKTLRSEMTKTGNTGAAATNKVTAAQGRLNKQVSLGRQLFLRLRSVMLTVFGAYAIIQGIRNTINTIKDFELGIARVQAITGATADEIDRLSNSAKILSETGIFNPTEITELQVKLAKLGFTIDEIAASTEGIINLATATGDDLAGSAELVASIIRGLGLEASETGRIVDVLGKAFTSSALDITKFRESAKFIVPLAKEMGWTIEELAAVLGKLSDAIISGSLAGTGLRTLFIELADRGSKLVEIMGEGINTFDEFVDALVKIRKEGVSTERILEAVPKRAVTLTTVLLSQGEALRVYADELKNASGAIKEMADIQMDTLANQLERLGAAWDSFILSAQESGGAATDVVSGLAWYLNLLSFWLNPASHGLERAAESFDRFKEAFLKGEDTATQIEQIALRIQFLTLTIQKMSDDDSSDSIAFIAQFREELRLLDALLDDINIASELKNYTDVLDAAAKGGFENFKKTYIRLISDISDEIVRVRDSYNEQMEGTALVHVEILKKQRDDELRVLNEILGGLDKYYIDRLDQFEKSISDNETLLADLKSLYARQEALEVERANNKIKNEMNLELELLAIRNRFRKLNLELELKYGNLTSDERALVQAQILEADITFNRERLEIMQRYLDEEYEENIKHVEDLLKYQIAVNNREINLLKLNNATKEEIWRRELELAIAVKKAQIQLAEATGATTAQLLTMNEELGQMVDTLNAGFQEKEVTKNTRAIAQAYKRLASEVVDYLQDIADAHVQNTERIVDDLNTRIAETQRALEIETELYAAGYANNVTLKREELAELQDARSKAIADREKAVRRQQQLESIAQAVDLGSAVASILKTYSGIPAVGLAIAGGVIAAMLALFGSFKAKASSLSQYGEGGEIDGKPHTQGGVVIEAEGGEFVMKKSAYAKYPELIRAINEDNLPEFNATVMNNVGGGGDVIVDNKVWHEIKDLLNKNLNKSTVSVIGGKKIVTRGIRKRTINV